MKYQVGVDVGGGTTTAGLILEGEIQAKKTVATGENPKLLIDSTQQAIIGLLEEEGIGLDSVSFVGVGVPAFMNPVSRRLRFPNIQGADNLNYKALLEKRLGIKVAVGNDADYTALGAISHIREFGVLKEGVGSQGAVELVLFTVGTGIGGGIVTRSGKKTTNLSSTHGLNELGHMKVTDNPRYLCSCGAIGCVEATSSCSAQVKQATKGLENAPKAVKEEFRDGFSAEDVDRLSEQENTLASQVMKSAGKYLGIASSNLLNALNPSILAFTGGGASSRPDSVFFKALLEALKQNTLEEAWEAASVVKNPDAKRYGILGAGNAVNQ